MVQLVEDQQREACFPEAEIAVARKSEREWIRTPDTARACHSLSLAIQRDMITAAAAS